MQTRRTFSKAALAGAVASAIVPLTSARRAFAAGPATKTVRLADQPARRSTMPAVWIAEGLGYLEQEGIKIDRRSYANGPAAMLRLPNGSIDAVMAAIVPFMQFAARGGEFKLIMSLTKGNAPLVGLKKFATYKNRRPEDRLPRHRHGPRRGSWLCRGDAGHQAAARLR